MTGETLSITSQRNGNAHRVVAVGELDLSTVDSLERALGEIDDGAETIVLDLSGRSFIDSTGIGVLVGVWRLTKATDGCLALASPSRQAQSVLDATGLTKVLSLYSTEEEAVQACAEPGMPTS